MPYITKTDVANFLSVTLTPAQGDLLDNDIIPAVSRFSDEYCNRKFEVSGNQTEIFDGGVNAFFVKYPPIDTVISVTIDGSPYDLSNAHNYKSFIRLDTTPTLKPQNVVIVYTSAVSLPEDVKNALVRWAGEIFQSAESSGKDISRFSAGSVTVEYKNSGINADNAMPPFVLDVLKRYRIEPL